MSLSFDSDSNDPDQEYGFNSLGVEYAKSGRAACKGCGKTITIRDLRYVIKGMSYEYYEYTKFCHAKCLTKVFDIKKAHNRLNVFDTIYGINTIINKDQKDIRK